MLMIKNAKPLDARFLQNDEIYWHFSTRSAGGARQHANADKRRSFSGLANTLTPTACGGTRGEGRLSVFTDSLGVF